MTTIGALRQYILHFKAWQLESHSRDQARHVADRKKSEEDLVQRYAVYREHAIKTALAAMTSDEQATLTAQATAMAETELAGKFMADIMMKHRVAMELSKLVTDKIGVHDFEPWCKAVNVADVPAE